jgi:hypothetical protein
MEGRKVKSQGEDTNPLGEGESYGYQGSRLGSDFSGFHVLDGRIVLNDVADFLGEKSFYIVFYFSQGYTIEEISFAMGLSWSATFTLLQEAQGLLMRYREFLY